MIIFHFLTVIAILIFNLRLMNLDLYNLNFISKYSSTLLQKDISDFLRASTKINKLHIINYFMLFGRFKRVPLPP